MGNQVDGKRGPSVGYWRPLAAIINSVTSRILFPREAGMLQKCLGTAELNPKERESKRNENQNEKESSLRKSPFSAQDILSLLGLAGILEEKR